MGIGEHITQVQKTFGKRFNAGPDCATDGRQFDRLFSNGDMFAVGSLQVQAIHTPGHTPACMTFVISAGQHACRRPASGR